MDECGICYNSLEPNIEYSKINNPHESGSYHVQCLTNWLNNSHNGILTQDKITSYQIFINNEPIQTVMLPTAPQIYNVEQEQYQEQYQEQTPIYIYHDEPGPNDLAPCSRGNICRLSACGLLIIVIIGILIFDYFITHTNHRA